MLQPIRRALLSVSDKTGLVDFAKILAGFGTELISTGGTRKTLQDAGLTVRDISEVTGFPEMLDGRVKTLHPKVHGGLLARRDFAEHMQTLQEHGIAPIDLVICNLYPFERVAAEEGRSVEEVIEQIDIGGPSMLRSAAKNYAAVAVVSDPEQYPAIIAELQQNAGSLHLETRQRLAAGVFERTARYDAAIAAYFARIAAKKEPFPPHLLLAMERKQSLRYGENPHQPASFYVETPTPRDSVAGAEVLHGKELSYNNILDLDSALNLVREFTEPGAVIVKHTNPCGAAIGTTLADAFQYAFDCDTSSAYGGILAFNRKVDLATAQRIVEPKRFVECIIAPDYEPEAFQIITTVPTWHKNVRLLKTGSLTGEGLAARQLDYRRVDGGLLVQQRDRIMEDPTTWKVVTKRAPTPEELETLAFAWKVVKHVKSNAIVLARPGRVIGVGAGQMNRFNSVEYAIRKADSKVQGAVMASDAFFPFPDGPSIAISLGVTAIVQPGGSIRDEASISQCDEHNVAMVFTGIRHFKH